MKDLYTIQEFSQLSGIETSTLRYWDDIGLFSPAQRNPSNNYRYYSLAQILALNFVTVLSELDIPLKTIAELRNERDPDNLMQLLEKQEKKMDMELRSLRLRYSIIHARRELITRGMKADESQISVIPMEEKELIIWPPNEYKEDDTFIEPLAAFIGKSRGEHVNLSFPVGGYYYDWDSFVRNPQKPQCFFSIDPTGLHTQSAGEYLVGYNRGYYAELGDLPNRMSQYAKEHSLLLDGAVYITYLIEEFCTANHAEYLAQAAVAVSRPKR